MHRNDAYRANEACFKCGSHATSSAGACLACGHAWGPLYACAHCGAVCGVREDVELGACCRSCRLPRISPGWKMPEATATRLRTAVVARGRGRVASAIALVLAVFAMPLGPVLLVRVGADAWIVCFVCWVAMIAVATWFRAKPRRSLQVALASAKDAFAGETEPLSIPAAAAQVRVSDFEALGERPRVATVAQSDTNDLDGSTIESVRDVESPHRQKSL
jgi:hypothetical protein